MSETPETDYLCNTYGHECYELTRLERERDQYEIECNVLRKQRNLQMVERDQARKERDEAVAALREMERMAKEKAVIITEIIAWLERSQPNVFKRGIWGIIELAKIANRRQQNKEE